MVAVEGLEGLAVDFAEITDRIAERASMAINTTARRYRTTSSRLIRDQVAFPARYLDAQANGALRVRQQATAAKLEAAIEGRFDPTSLARFAKGTVAHGRKAPRLRVNPGRTTQIPNSFIMNLRNGNRGLAIRLKPGETIQNKRRMVSFSRKDSNLYLLYGPSVDQVFRSVALDVAPDAASFLETEFIRLTENLI
ncbi:hypothetical protein SDSG_00041 [Ruegeria phage DSS3-P1]|nr:hypothetical protein SDSG_00041 [Ruegeria phage DSS3-P1]